MLKFKRFIYNKVERYYGFLIFMFIYNYFLMRGEKMSKIHVDKKQKQKLMQTNNYQYYKKYQNSMRIKGTSSKTLHVYECYFFIFLDFLNKRYNDIDLYSIEFDENAVDIMEDFMMYLQEELGNGKKIINTKLSTISSFFLWSLKRKIIKNHPFDKQLDRVKDANKEKLRKPQFLSSEQIDIVKRELAINEKYNLQDQVLFSLVIDSANRVGAISELKLSNLDKENMLFTDVVEKGNEEVEVIFEEETSNLINEWLAYRKKELDGLKVDALFITRYAGEWRPMSYATIQARFRGYGINILGLERFGMHDGRKTKANLIYEETGDLTMAQDWLNHKSSATTQLHYIKERSKSDLREKARLKALEKKSNKD